MKFVQRCVPNGMLNCTSYLCDGPKHMTNKIEKSIRRFTLAKQDRILDFSRYSHARLGLGHTGGHLPVQAWLDLQKDFAQAKDAVSSQLDVKQIISLCHVMNLTTIELQSQANDGMQFLLRPDLGRLLSIESEIQLKNTVKQHSDYCQCD